MRFIYKKIICGCKVMAKIQDGVDYASIMKLIDNSCDFCTKEQQNETVKHFWLNETEKYKWKELVKSHGWSIEPDYQDQSDKIGNKNLSGYPSLSSYTSLSTMSSLSRIKKMNEDKKEE